MSFGQFLSILKARRWIALAVLLSTVIITLAVSLLLPKQYTATASVVVDSKPDPVSAILYSGTASPGYMATQVDVLLSDRVALRVVRDLKLNENEQVRQQWLGQTEGKGSVETWLSQNLQRQMDVKPSRESSVINVSYKAPDPQFAAALANAFVQAYLRTTLELRVDPARQYSSFFDTRSKEARDALEASQRKLSAYQKEKGIIASDERLDVETARLAELSSQSVLLQSLASESSSRQMQSRGGQAERMQEVLSNPVISGLKVDLSRAEGRLQELSSRLGDNNPQVQEVKATISSLRSKIATEVQSVTGGVGVSNNINRQREADVRAALELQRAKVLRIKAVRDEGAVLMRDVESAQRAFESITQRFTQTSLESQTTQSNINLLTSATPPIEPSSPKVVFNSLLSIFIGALLAVGVALLLEIWDRRVRNVEDVVAALGLPVIGIMPKPNARKLGRMSKPSLAQQRVVGRLAAPGKGA